MRLSFEIRRDHTLTTISWDNKRRKMREDRPYEVSSTLGWMRRTRTRQFGRVVLQQTVRNADAVKTRHEWNTPSFFDQSFALRHD